MLAMNTLALERARQNHAHMERRGEQNHPTPRYGEDVKWLLKIALKLGNLKQHKLRKKNIFFVFHFI